MEEKKITTWQIFNLKIKEQAKPVKVVNFNINAAKLQCTYYDAICTLFAQYTYYTTKLPQFVNQ